MSDLSEDERELFTSVFQTMDENENGWLSVEEMMEGFRRLGFNLTQEEAEAYVDAIDTNNDGQITLDEFLVIMCQIEDNNPRAQKEAKLRRAFRDMDVDENGLLREKELMNGMKDAGYHLSKEQIKKLCNDLDKNGDGKIDFEEFIQMFQL